MYLNENTSEDVNWSELIKDTIHCRIYVIKV
jgi:hypothetical protein